MYAHLPMVARLSRSHQGLRLLLVWVASRVQDNIIARCGRTVLDSARKDGLALVRLA